MEETKRKKIVGSFLNLAKKASDGLPEHAMISAFSDMINAHYGCRSINDEVQKYNQQTTGKTMTNIIIPLKNGGSKRDNIELRMLLRSIDKFVSGYDKVLICGETMPEWVKNVEFVQSKEDQNGKQKNIHNAIKAGMNFIGDMSSKFLFCADDNIFCAQVNAGKIPVVFRNKDLSTYDGNAADFWNHTCGKTAEVLASNGCRTINFEAHTPCVFEAHKYMRLDRYFDFYAERGLCYISVYYNFYGIEATHMMEQVKATCHDANFNQDCIRGKLFIGYNDAGADAVIDYAKNNMLKEKCRFEQ